MNGILKTNETTEPIRAAHSQERGANTDAPTVTPAGQPARKDAGPGYFHQVDSREVRISAPTTVANQFAKVLELAGAPVEEENIFALIEWARETRKGISKAPTSADEGSQPSEGVGSVPDKSLVASRPGVMPDSRSQAGSQFLDSMLTVAEASPWLKKSVKWLREDAKKRNPVIPVFKPNQGFIRYNPRTVIAALAERARVPAHVMASALGISNMQ